MCEFGWPSSRFGGRLGAVHGLEIPFIFDTLNPNLPLFGPLLGEDPSQQLADTRHAAWIDLLAADGDPGWPRYDLNLRATMRFNTGSQLWMIPDPGNGSSGKASASSCPIGMDPSRDAIAKRPLNCSARGERDRATAGLAGGTLVQCSW